MLDGISTASNDKDHHNVNGNFVSSVWSQMKSKMKEMAYIKISNHFLLPANTQANFIIFIPANEKQEIIIHAGEENFDSHSFSSFE